MATLLDIGFSGIFSTIFSMLLIFVLLYALLTKYKVVSDKPGLNALIAISIAFLFLLVPGLTKVISLAAPWFVVMIVLIFVILLMSMFLGATESDISKAFKEDGLAWWIIIIAVLILVAVFGTVYRSQFEEINKVQAEGGDTTGQSLVTIVGVTLFNPKVLGMLLIFMIAALAVGRLAAYVK